MSLCKQNILSVLLIAAVACIIYSNSFDASFHFDDLPAIVENYTIHRFDIQKIFSASPRPVLDITFALNYYFGKLDVFGYHLVNLLLHIANGTLIYFILLWTVNPLWNNYFSSAFSRETSGHLTERQQAATFDTIRVPLYASLIFIAHPIQTQAVTYIVSRSSVLATFFYLLTILLFIGAFRQKSRGLVPRSLICMAGAIIASCLGMGTKAIAVTLPLMVLMYDFHFISSGDWRKLKSHCWIHILLFATVFIRIYWSFSGLEKFISFDYANGVPMPPVKGGGSDIITSFEYFLTQLHVVSYYIKLLFIPINLNLDYDWQPTKSIDMLTAFYFLFLSGIFVLGILLFRKARLISFGIIWFFVTLSVTSSFLVIHDYIFEHRLYLPSVGFAIIIAFLISRISQIKLQPEKGS